MLFSVIIPFYNRGHLVSEVLESVLSQTENDYEIIAVDDGSTDDTWKHLQAYKDRVHCLRTENQGAAMARNSAVEQAKGRYLAFLDSDDLWFPFSLALYREVIESHDGPSVVTGKPVIFESAEAVKIPEKQAVEVEAFSCYYSSHSDWRWFGVSSFVIKREAFDKAGGFAKKRINAEDADLMMKLGTAPGFVHITQPQAFAYRRHEDNLTNNSQLNFVGITHLLDSEKAGIYPGTGKDVLNRRIILTRHIRPMVLSGLKSGKYRLAWTLYRKTFFWHLRQGRFRFLLYVAAGLLLKGWR